MMDNYKLATWLTEILETDVKDNLQGCRLDVRQFFKHKKPTPLLGMLVFLYNFEPEKLQREAIVKLSNDIVTIVQDDTDQTGCEYYQVLLGFKSSKLQPVTVACEIGPFFPQSDQTQKSVAAENGDNRAILTSHYRHEHPDTLAFYCSDGRFTRAVEELCAALGADRIDTVTLPGGPGLLDLGKLALSDRGAVTKALGFLIPGHKIERCVLVAHVGCGYYRTRYPRKNADEIEKIQRADLISARELVSKEFGTEIYCYYARVVDDRIRFEPIE